MEIHLDIDPQTFQICQKNVTDPIPHHFILIHQQTQNFDFILKGSKFLWMNTENA